MGNDFGERDDIFDENLIKIIEMAAAKDEYKQSAPPKVKQHDDDSDLHSGHRKRVYAAADKDELLEPFSYVEALDFFLFAALPSVNTNDVAHRLLRSFGSLSGVFSATVDDLSKIKGMSRRVAYFLKGIPAISRKSQLTRIKPESIRSVNAALDYLKMHFEHIYTETMYVMSLDISDRILGVDCVTARGTATSSNVSIPAIMESVCRHHGTKIIVAHNHPGGVMLPSKQDIGLTDLIIDALAALDVVLVDHLIFSPEDSFLSFFNSGIIRTMYFNFDRTHGSNLSRFLPDDEPHCLSSGTEYLFDLKTASLIRKSEYHKFFSESMKMGRERMKAMSDYGVENKKGKKN